ncbi:MAG: endolytic transglycosylase MltG [bacterium]|nr:endolytic transglycosylase MltG [bacterium]MDZ4285240.1 endolytic transglycosylase MltG [Patescibacteria group bacterium]
MFRLEMFLRFLRRITPRTLRWLWRDPPHFAATAAVLLSLVGYLFFVRAPAHFPVGSIVMIPKGLTLHEAGVVLENAQVIRSPLLLRLVLALSGSERAVIAGDYFFSMRSNIFGIARRIRGGEYGLAPGRVLVQEGATRSEIAEILAAKFGRFDPTRFIEITLGAEGYLFPDTYFFLPTVSAEEVARVMREQFDARIASLAPEIEAFGRPLADIITMASLIEKEAHDLETMRRIASVLWNRMEVGMPLQVDAAFLYINGKNTFELTHDDLATTSPYNTYKHIGLPPGPIASPGLGAIEAAVTPVETDYLFYLSDRSGHTYFARTFDEHKVNRRLYLD